MLEKLKFGLTANIKRNYLINSLPYFENLSILGLKYFSGDYSPVSYCLSSCLKLKNLNISFFEIDSHNLSKSLLITLKDLENLTIKVSENCEEFAKAICSNLFEIRYLDLFSCCKLSDNSIQIFCKLKKLEVLKLEWLSLSGIGFQLLCSAILRFTGVLTYT